MYWCIRPLAGRPVQATGHWCKCCLSPTSHVAYHNIHIQLIVILWEHISDPKAVLVTHITHLGKFTVMPAETPELRQPIQISVYLKASQPMEIARIFLIIPAPSWGGAEGTDPFPTLKLTRYKGKKQGGGGGRSRGVTWRRGVNRQFYWKAYRRQTWTSLVVPDAWQHWLYKPSRQETAVSVVHWYSLTGQLLWRSLKQPSIQLSQKKGPSGVWLIGSLRFKLIET